MTKSTLEQVRSLLMELRELCRDQATRDLAIFIIEEQSPKEKAVGA